MYKFNFKFFTQNSNDDMLPWYTYSIVYKDFNIRPSRQPPPQQTVLISGPSDSCFVFLGGSKNSETT